MKTFLSLAGAHKYAENASRKYEDDRFVIWDYGSYSVVTKGELGEEILAHYFKGELMDEDSIENV